MNLGQVYTKNSVAEYMVSLLALPDGARVLDPCFGTGAFVEALVADGRFVVEGVEMDEDSFATYENRNTDRCSLSCRDFFTLEEKDKFDGVIMNPPYVRQEEIDEMREKYGVCKDRLKKTRRDIETQFKQITVDGDEVTEETLSDKSQIDYVNAVPLSWFAQVRRGKSTGCNKVFINPQIMSTQCQREILSSPKQVAGFTTNGAKTDKYLLITSEKTELDEAVRDYLEQCADYIRKKQEPKSLYEQIQHTPYWYVTNDIGAGDIVFPYIIRDSIRFILNDKKLLARDNFYCINSAMDKYLLMALLNNHFVWLQLEKCGKTYGNNVLKIQKYDVDDLMIISPEIISAEDKETLKRLAKDLAETSDTENIGKKHCQLRAHSSPSARRRAHHLLWTDAPRPSVLHNQYIFQPPECRLQHPLQQRPADYSTRGIAAAKFPRQLPACGQEQTGKEPDCRQCRSTKVGFRFG